MPDASPPTRLQVFLCHAAVDKPAVVQIYNRLSSLNWIKPWLDRKDLLPGQNWQIEIPKAVRRSEIVLVCLSKNSINKAGYVQKEIVYALDVAEEKPEGTIYLIPLRLEECEVPERLSMWHWVDYFEEDGFEQLLRGLRYQADGLGLVEDAEAVRQRELQTAREEAAREEAARQEAARKQAEVERQAEIRQQAEERQRAEAAKREAERQAHETAEARHRTIEPLLNELADLRTNHQRRREIGEKLAEMGDPRPGVGVDSDGVPGIAWLPVTPGGQIEIARQKYKVVPFYIAKYPVTFLQYEAFVKANDGYNDSRWWRGLEKQELAEQAYEGINRPRENVSWYQAVAFTRWLNYRMQGRQLPPIAGVIAVPIIGQNAEVRLPLEWEWQWAAQGGQDWREYPWGKRQEGYANTDAAELKQTIAVGMYPQGAAFCGTLDMSGNVWEWCLNKYSKDRNWRVVRGGSFDYDSYRTAASYRNDLRSYDRSLDLGFRLVVSSPIAPSDL